MTSKTKKALVCGGILIGLSVITGISYGIYSDAKKEKFIFDTIQEYSQMEEFVNRSTKGWDNTVWLGSVNRDDVHSINFVKKYNGEGTKAWLFDGLACYLNESDVYIVVGDYIKLTGTMNGAFAGLQNLKSITGLELVDTSEVQDMSFLFQKCISLEEIDLSSLETDSIVYGRGMFLDCNKLKQIDLSLNNMINLENANSMFENCTSASVIQLPKTEKLKTASKMFKNVGKTSGDGAVIKGTMNTRQCEDISYIVAESIITNVNFMENIDTSSVINAEYAFYGCGLESIDLSNWKTANIKNMNSMFAANMSMNKCDISGWDVSSLEQCESMFFYDTSLSDLKIEWVNVGNISKMNKMFKLCSSLQVLDLSMFDDLHFGDTREMFAECDELKTLYLYNIDSDVSDNMFLGCISLCEGIEDKYYDIDMGNTNNFFSRKE